MFLLPLIASIASAQPGGVVDLRHGQHVTLEVPFRYDWTALRPTVDQVTAVVVGVEDPDVLGRQVGAPVLYVGEVPAQVVNNGRGCACVVAVVPGHVDLATTVVFLGSDRLPGRVDDVFGAAELAAAVALGVDPLGRVSEVMQPSVALHDDVALYALLADLIDVHAPDEADRAANLRRASQRGVSAP